MKPHQKLMESRLPDAMLPLVLSAVVLLGILSGQILQFQAFNSIRGALRLGSEDRCRHKIDEQNCGD